VPGTDGLVALTVAAGGRSFPDRWRSGNFNAGPPIVAGRLVWTAGLSAGALAGRDQGAGGRSRQPMPQVSRVAGPSSAGGCLCVRRVAPSRRCAQDSEICLRIWRPPARSGRAGEPGEEAERLAGSRP